MTIWELRNPRVMRLLAKATFDFNFNQDAIDKISAFKPIDTTNLGIDTAID